MSNSNLPPNLSRKPPVPTQGKQIPAKTQSVLSISAVRSKTSTTPGSSPGSFQALKRPPVIATNVLSDVRPRVTSIVAKKLPATVSKPVLLPEGWQPVKTASEQSLLHAILGDRLNEKGEYVAHIAAIRPYDDITIPDDLMTQIAHGEDFHIKVFSFSENDPQKRITYLKEYGVPNSVQAPKKEIVILKVVSKDNSERYQAVLSPEDREKAERKECGRTALGANNAPEKQVLSSSGGIHLKGPEIRPTFVPKPLAYPDGYIPVATLGGSNCLLHAIFGNQVQMSDENAVNQSGAFLCANEDFINKYQKLFKSNVDADICITDIANTEKMQIVHYIHFENGGLMPPSMYGNSSDSTIVRIVEHISENGLSHFEALRSDYVINQLFSFTEMAKGKQWW